ncbi:SRPBCC domain-containing protein [Chitinophaga sp. Cy-1792]|nr:SRPBCC domain-containing protein [Chitinophaga sp. Cy-1792]
MNAINWPPPYLPGTTDNFCSNEVIVAGLSAEDIWPYLSHPYIWPEYYSNASAIEFDNGGGPQLNETSRFRFRTFGFPMEAEVTEFVAPVDGSTGRLSWHGWMNGDANTKFDVLHCWLVENLSEERVRILTQESQIGLPAKELAKSKPNKMINGHQDWLDGLVTAARSGKKK